MRTDDLIDQLASGVSPVADGAPPRRLAALAAGGALLALVLVLAWLKLRPDLAQAVTGPMFWIKAGYMAALGLAGFWACERLARPEGRAGKALIFGGGVLALFVAIAVGQVILASPDQRLGLILGHSITHCLRNILILGLPTTFAGLLVLRWMAPTRPMLAGFAAGVFAGGVAATVYGLHCAESTMTFLGLWYTLGVLGCATVGAVAGRWLLRW